MLSSQDFSKKQIVFVFFNQGEKLSFSNDNFVVKDKDGKIKFQTTCYRLFLVYAVGHGTITSGLIQRSRKFGFSIVLMNQNLRPYQTVGSVLEGNTKLRRLQYGNDSLDIARHLTRNKIINQQSLIMALRNKNEMQKEAIDHLRLYAENVDKAESVHELMGTEGAASRVFFANYFNNVCWKRREPRTKSDMVNALLDIGYTILFSIVEALLNCYGFDIYQGVMHTNFYMRKSLVCDLIEPFRCIVEETIRKAINLKQCREEDFYTDNGRFVLRWEKNAYYISWLASPIVERRTEIHRYIQTYYRAFMKQKSIDQFPMFYI